MSVNIAYVYLPHFDTNCFRVDITKQQGKKVNYIVCCCSPGYLGVWKWRPEIKGTLDVWSNKGKPCYCVPIDQCEFVQTLESIKTPDMINEIKKQQKAFCKKYRKNDIQQWML